MHVLAVDAHAEQLRIARPEFLLQPAEGGDLGGTDEGEVLRPEEHHLPLAGEALVGEGAKRALHIVGHHAGERKLRKTTADA
jgi:hypothetical protein